MLSKILRSSDVELPAAHVVFMSKETDERASRSERGFAHRGELQARRYLRRFWLKLGVRLPRTKSFFF